MLPQSGYREWNKHLVTGVVTNLREASVPVVTSYRTDFQKCMFRHTLPEKLSKQKKQRIDFTSSF